MGSRVVVIGTLLVGSYSFATPCSELLSGEKILSMVSLKTTGQISEIDIGRSGLSDKNERLYGSGDIPADSGDVMFLTRDSKGEFRAKFVTGAKQNIAFIARNMADSPEMKSFWAFTHELNRRLHVILIYSGMLRDLHGDKPGSVHLAAMGDTIQVIAQYHSWLKLTEESLKQNKNPNTMPPQIVQVILKPSLLEFGVLQKHFEEFLGIAEAKIPPYSEEAELVALIKTSFLEIADVVRKSKP